MRFLLITLAFPLMAAELKFVSEPPQFDVRKCPCEVYLSAEGGKLTDLRATVLTNHVPPGVTAALPSEIEKDDVQPLKIGVELSKFSVGPAELIIRIHYKDAGVLKSKDLKVKLEFPAVVYSWNDGKPLILPVTRDSPFWPASFAGEFALRASGKGYASPQLQNADIYRTVGEERILLPYAEVCAQVDGNDPNRGMRVNGTLPGGNYTTASIDYWLTSAENPLSLKVPVVVRIKDRVWVPLLVLSLSHFLFLYMRTWVTKKRPARVLQARMARVAEDLQEYLAAGIPSDTSEVLQIKLILATARRQIDDDDFVGAAAELAKTDALMAAIAKAKPEFQKPVTAPMKLDEPASTIRERIRKGDWGVELLAAGFSLLIGLQVYINAPTFGTYEDYLKCLLFAFGISSTTQGFKGVYDAMMPKG